jgi:hypothetical protein
VGTDTAGRRLTALLLLSDNPSAVEETRTGEAEAARDVPVKAAGTRTASHVRPMSVLMSLTYSLCHPGDSPVNFFLTEVDPSRLVSRDFSISL